MEKENIYWQFYHRDKFARKVIPLVNVNNLDYTSRHTLTKNDVCDEHLWNFHQRNMDFNKNLNLKGQYCYHPFNTITVDGNGDVFVCVCQSWLPISVGNILEFQDLNDIVKSPKAREIQASIIDGSYRYCDHSSCSIIKGKELKPRVDHRYDGIIWINFSVDYSCNLSCPSCRSEFKFINSDSGPDFFKRLSIVFHLAKLIEKHNHHIKFTLANDGDPFASDIYLTFLAVLDLTSKEINDVEIEIVTNGILLASHWKKLEKVHKNIIRTKISFDAGSEEVYNITRRGGKWAQLIKNIKYLRDWKDKNHSNMILTSNFVVQTANYKDLVKYAILCDSLGFDEINFQKIDNWGTFKNFKEHAIWQKDHPLYFDFLQEIQNLQNLKNKKINLTNLTDIVNEVV